MENLDLLIEEFKTVLLQNNRVKAYEVFEKCSNNFEAIEKVTMTALEKIGVDWNNGDCSLAQVYMSGVVCEELMEKYLPKFEIPRKDSPKMAIGVLLDHHPLGKKIVYSIVRAAGYDILDFGHGLSVNEIVNKTIENEVKILIISTLMYPSALKVSEVRESFDALNYNVKIIVGGAPYRLDKNLWQTVHADADGKNASDIIGVIESIIREGV